MSRILKHPVLPVETKPEIAFTFDGNPMRAKRGEMISSALIANGVHIFSYHKDDTPQGIFCANGQCAQCTLLVDGLPVKSCITPIEQGMRIETLRGLPSFGGAGKTRAAAQVQEKNYDAVIVGAGPSGLAAAAELGKAGASVLVIDDKDRAGGKLVLQTHKFFGSQEDCYAGTRGIEIAGILEKEAARYPNVEIWLNSFAVGVFSDSKLGVVRNGSYMLLNPRALLIAAGAREKFLPFPGNTLPGIYGAGAFQTLVNRDLIAPCEKLFIVGGGNVGLIAGYHALQAGIKVAGLIEAMPKAGGYKVHADKLVRLGVPIYTSHTIVKAEGDGHVSSVTIAEVDERFKPKPGTFKKFEVDTVLIAVGLDRCSELYSQAKKFRMNVFSAGDAEEIAEASAAMFSGKITGRDMARDLGLVKENAPKEWKAKLEVLKSRPGKTEDKKTTDRREGVFPVFHCRQEIPCNPCISVCPKKSISQQKDNILSLPKFEGECAACGNCVAVCPGLAVTLVDYRSDAKFPFVTMAYEIGGDLKPGGSVTVTDETGAVLGTALITGLREVKASKTVLLTVKTAAETANRVAGIKVTEGEPAKTTRDTSHLPDETIICRCERVSLGEIRKAIRSGVRDLNQLKAMTRAGMGACGSKTCLPQLINIFRDEGVPYAEITQNTSRPLTMEVTLGQFCNAGETAGTDSHGGDY